MYREIIKEKLAGVERFELPTIGFGDRCSTNWNYTPAAESNYTDATEKVKRKYVFFLCLLSVRCFYLQTAIKIGFLFHLGCTY